MIVDLAGSTELVELGSGSASKTRALLFAMAGAGMLERYLPVDVSESVVERSAEELVEIYPGLQVHGVVGDFEQHLRHVPVGDRPLVAFLGGTIGNFYPEARADFLSRTRELLGDEGRLLLGTDLAKEVEILEAAYNDSAGVTAEFNRNVLHAINRELDADFDPDAFEHVAFFDEAESWIEMRLRANGEQRVNIAWRRPRPDPRGRRGDPHGDQHEVHARAARGGAGARRGCGSRRSSLMSTATLG